MAVTVSITVTRGSAVTVFAQFTKPTRTSAKGGGAITQVAADPTTVKVVWKPAGGTETTWTYGTGAQIAKLETGLYVATIPTKTAEPSISGKVVGTGDVTAVGQFSIGVNAPAI